MNQKFTKEDVPVIAENAVQIAQCIIAQYGSKLAIQNSKPSQFDVFKIMTAIQCAWPHVQNITKAIKD